MAKATMMLHRLQPEDMVPLCIVIIFFPSYTHTANNASCKIEVYSATSSVIKLSCTYSQVKVEVLSWISSWLDHWPTKTINLRMSLWATIQEVVVFLQFLQLAILHKEVRSFSTEASHTSSSSLIDLHYFIMSLLPQTKQRPVIPHHAISLFAYFNLDETPSNVACCRHTTSRQCSCCTHTERPDTWLPSSFTVQPILLLLVLLCTLFPGRSLPFCYECLFSLWHDEQRIANGKLSNVLKRLVNL